MEHTAGRNITEGSIWKGLLLYFFPIWFGSVFQTLYTTVDAAIVGRFVGKEALAALGGTTSLLVDLTIGFFIGASAGVGVVISHCYGAKDAERLRYSVHQAIRIAVICGLILMVSGFIATPSALRLLHAPEEIMDAATIYLRVYFCGAVASLIYNMGAGVLRAVGDARRPLYFLIFTTIVNIVLDILFVALFHMGVFGAALATVLSQVASAILVLRTLLKTTDSYRLVGKGVGKYPETFRKILRLGLPAGLQYTLYTISNLIIQAQINLLGTDIMAAWTATSKIDGIFWLTMTAFGTTMMTFTGQNYGAEKMERIRQGMHRGIVIALGLTIGICGPILLFAEPLMKIFTTDKAVMILGVQILFFMVPTYVTYAPTELLGGVIKGLGNSFVPMVLSAISVCALRSLWALIAPTVWPGLEAVMFSYPFSWVISSVLYILYYNVGPFMKTVWKNQAVKGER